MLDEVQSVRVIRGPLAVLYGNGAGGVVHLQTLAPEHSQAGLRTLVGEGNRERQSLTGQWREGQWAARVQGSRFTSEGERPHAEAERRHAGGQLYYNSEGGVQTTVRVDTSRDPLLQDPQGLTPEQWRDDPKAGNPAAETFNTRKQLRHRQASVQIGRASCRERGGKVEVEGGVEEIRWW